MKTIALAAAFLAVVYVAHAVECPPKNEADVTLVPNPEDCSTFYLCNDGIPYLMSCPAGLNFNAQLRVCDLPINAQCVPTEEPEEPTTLPDDPEESTPLPDVPEEPASNGTEVAEITSPAPVSNITEV